MSNYYGYVSVDALMDFAHNHVNGMIDSNDIARFPKANVKDANEQQSLQEILGVSFDRLRELAEAEREGRVVIMPFKPGTKFAQPDDPNHEFDMTFSGDVQFCISGGEESEYFSAEDLAHFTEKFPIIEAATEPKGDAKT